MKTLSADAQADIVKLTGGQAWVEVVDISLPSDYESSAIEDTFIAIAPDLSKHILLCNGFNNDKVVMRVASWQTPSHAAGLKVFWSVPYERDNIEDSSDKRGAVNTRITIGDAGNTIGSIMDKTDGMIGLGVSIGMALVDHDDALTVADGTIVVFEPDILYDFVVNAATHDGINFSITLAIDTPLEWKYPENTMLKNVCPFKYGGPECGYSGSMTREVKPAAIGTIDVVAIYNNWLLGASFIANIKGALQRLIKPTVPPATLPPLFTTEALTADKAARYAVENTASVYYLTGSYLKRIDSTTKAVATVSGIDVTSSAIVSDKDRLSTGLLDACNVISGSNRMLYAVNGVTPTATPAPNAYYLGVTSGEIGTCYAIRGANSAATTGIMEHWDGTTLMATDSTLPWTRFIFQGASECLAQSGNYLYHCVYVTGTTITVAQVLDDLGNPIDLSTLAAGTTLQTSWPFFLGTFMVGGVETKRLFWYDWTTFHQIHDEITWEFISQDPASSSLSDPFCLAIADDMTYRISKTEYVPVANLQPGRYDAFSAINYYSFYSVRQDKLYFTDTSIGTVGFPCLHTLSSCKEHGNETRFGGFPGIGAGGLMQ